jgi:transcriptional regulator with XRE-family HTH domain
MTTTERIGARVRELREQMGLSAQKVSDRCALDGAPELRRQVITNLENGRRESVTVDELLALALALRTSPADLLLPPKGELAVTSEISMDPYHFAEWFTGNGGPWERLTPPEFRQNNRRVRLYLDARRGMEGHRSAQRRLKWAESEGVAEGVKRSAQEYADMELRLLAQALDALIDAELEPPRLGRDTVRLMITRELTKYPDELMAVSRGGDDSPEAT